MKNLLPLAGAFFAAGLGLLTAAQPAWWTTGSTAFIDASPHDVVRNYDAANLGQLKNVATKAALYFNNTLPTPGAAAQINAMVTGFHHSADDYDAVTVGQLKAVAKPFYDRLLGLGFDTKLSLRNQGMTTWAYDSPWNPATPASENYAVANVGQLKWAFSFELTGFSVVDTDGDGLTNAWENAHGLSASNPSDAAASDVDSDGLPDVWEIKWGMAASEADSNGNDMCDAFEDFDGDGLSNEMEAAFNLNPYGLDTDGDTMPDDWELANDFDPTNPADGAQDIDLDGSSNAAEFQAETNPKEDVEPVPERRIEVWTKDYWKDWKWNEKVWDSEVPGGWETWIWKGRSAPGEQRIIPGTTASMFCTAWFHDQYRISRWEYYFKNAGSDGPLEVKWMTYDYDNNLSNNLLSLTAHSVSLQAGSQSGLYQSPYPGSPQQGRGILIYDVLEDMPERNFDNFERYAAANAAPGVLPLPWLMVPTTASTDPQPTSSALLRIIASGLFPLKISATSGLAVTPPATIVGGSRYVEVTGTGEGDGFVYLAGQQETSEENKVKILHAVRLPKIECIVKPYKVIGHFYYPANSGGPATWRDVSPENLPTRAELEEGLNEIYGNQMNVHFTVNDFGPDLGPVSYDVGVAGYPKSEKNRTLDFLAEPNTTPEEAALYAAGYTPNVINVYFLPGGLGHPAGTGLALGTSRPEKKAALIGHQMALTLTGGPDAAAKAKAALLQCVAHEIGHLGMGPGRPGAKLCLRHPREGGKLETNASSPDYLAGFPLRRQSDDLKRLMWWEADVDCKLLIKDEWMKFRASKDL